MEDLFGILVVVVSFIIWVTQSVAQAKKRASEEFDQTLDEIEDVEEELVEPRPPSPRPMAPPPLLPERTERPVPQGAPTWKELQRQLEQVLGQPSSPAKGTTTRPVSNLPRPLPGAEPSRSFDKPVPTAGSGPRPRPSERPSYQPQPVPRPSPQPSPRPAVVTRSATSREALPRAVFATSSGPGSQLPGQLTASGRDRRTRPGKFPNLHPDPIANAVILAEILKPYSGGPVSWRSR